MKRFVFFNCVFSDQFKDVFFVVKGNLMDFVFRVIKLICDRFECEIHISFRHFAVMDNLFRCRVFVQCQISLLDDVILILMFAE